MKKTLIILMTLLMILSLMTACTSGGAQGASGENAAAEGSQATTKDSPGSTEEALDTTEETLDTTEESQETTKESPESTEESQQTTKDSQESTEEILEAKEGSQESTKDSQESTEESLEATEESLETPEESQDLKDYAGGTPWPIIDLDGIVNKDTPVDAKDNFALYANKEDILSLKIPEDAGATGPMLEVSNSVDKDLIQIFQGDEPESHDAKLAYNLYQLMMDWDSRNTAGVEPLKKQTDAVEKLDTIDKLTAYLRDTPKADQPGALWYAGIGTDYEDSDKNVIQVGNDRLLLIDSAEYSKLTDYGKVIKDAKLKLAERMLKKLGYTKKESQQKIDNALSFETELAPVLYSSKEKKGEDIYGRMNNHYSREELRKAEGKLPILEQLDQAGYPEQEYYVVGNPAFLEKLNELYTEENLQRMRDLIIVKGVISKSDNLDRECFDWSNECSKEIEGTDVSPMDDEMFSQAISGMLKWPVAQLYTETYLKEEDKERITKLVEEIKEAYRGILTDADFLSDETRKKAIEKLDAIGAKVLYPDSWEDYNCEGLDFKGPSDGGTLWEALRAYDAYEIQEEVKELSEPVDKEKWAITPQAFNCNYDPQTNSIYILGAYAQGAIYHSEMSDEEVLAKLGTSIGHEISHAFDRTGAQFDKDGNMKNWWTKEDKKEFKKRNEKLAAYYDAIHPWEGQDLDGSSMTGEACADMAGMKVCLRIASKKENFDYDKFYRAFANLWMIKENLMTAQALVQDVHSMNYLRINCTLQQFDEFLNQYDITEGDKMYLAPDKRVNIW